MSAIDWKHIEGPYGPATELPDLLDRIATEPKGKGTAALRKLSNLVNHQGQIFPAAAVAVTPLLVDLLRRPEVGHKAKLAILLGNMVVGGDHTSVLATGWDVSDPRFVAADDDHPYKQIYRAVSAGHDTLLALLAADTPAERTAAAFALAFLSDRAEASREAVLAQLKTEKNAKALASSLLCLGYLSRYLGTDDRALLLDHASSKKKIPRLAAILGLIASGLAHDELSEALCAALVESVRDHPKPVTQLPWCDGAPWELAVHVLADVGHSRRDADFLWSVLEASEDLPTKGRALHALMDVVLGPPTDAMPSWRELDPAQQQFLVRLRASKFMWSAGKPLKDRGFWPNEPGLARHAGETPAGPLDAEVGGEPLWRLFARAFVDDEARPAWLDAVATLDEVEALAVCIDVMESPYPMRARLPFNDSDIVRHERGRRIQTLVTDTLVASTGARALREACHEALEREAGNPTHAALLTALAQFGPVPDIDTLRPALLEALGANEYVPGMRAVLEGLDPATREELVLELKLEHFFDEDARPEPRNWFRGGWSYWELCPTGAMAERVVGAITSWEAWQRPFPEDFAVDALVGIGEPARAAIEAALADEETPRRELLERALDGIG